MTYAFEIHAILYMTTTTTFANYQLCITCISLDTSFAIYQFILVVKNAIFGANKQM